MYVNVQTIITAAALLAALIAIVKAFTTSVRWFDKQQKQDDGLNQVRVEQAILCRGVLACLKGLKEQGCDGPVTEAIIEIEQHLNEQAHREV